MRDGCLGYLESIDHAAGELRLEGWIVHTARPVDFVTVRIDDGEPRPAELRERPEAAESFALGEAATPRGFRASIPVCREALSDWFRIRVAASFHGEALGGLSMLYLLGLAEGLPLPPAGLRERVIHSTGEGYYLISAIRTLGDFQDGLAPHQDLASIARVLDWGCGCGRVTALLGRLAPSIELHGCDVDAEAIGWCRRSLAPAEFRVTPIEPPTDYADATFDLVLGNSVCSHLERGAQERWVEEVERVLKPGGVALLTVHGEFAARVRRLPPGLRERVLAELQEDGISDFILDGTLDRAVPAGCYRGTFQNEAYTRRAWSRGLQILDYRERAVAGHQDLVVARRLDG